MVRPAAMRESSTPSARPLKTCDRNRPRLGIRVPPSFYETTESNTLSGWRHLATCVTHRRQRCNANGYGYQVNQIVLVFDFARCLAANNRKVRCAIVVFGAEVDFAAHGVRTL